MKKNEKIAVPKKKKVASPKKKETSFVSNFPFDTQSVLIGAILAGSLGGLAVTVYSMNQANNSKGYLEDYSEKIKTLLHDLNSNVTGNIHDAAENLSEKGKDIIEYLHSEIPDLADLENKDFRKGLLLGAILGALLGAGGTSLLRSGESDQGTDWKKMAANVLNMFDEKKAAHSLKNFPQTTGSMKDVVNFALAGLQFWSKLKKR